MWKQHFEDDWDSRGFPLNVELFEKKKSCEYLFFTDVQNNCILQVITGRKTCEPKLLTLMKVVGKY